MGDENTKDEGRYDAPGLAEAGMYAFWKCVTEVCKREYPEITTGDLPPDVDLMLGKVCEAAVRAWLEANTPLVATRELRVVLRGPKTGERGWWVAATTAEDALAEVLRESEELGWIAQRDYHTHERDAEGMRPVTIEIGRAP